MLKKVAIILFLFFHFTLSAFAQINTEEYCDEPKDKKNSKKYEQALELYNKHRYTESLKLLKEIQELEPEYADPYFLLGMIAMKKENINSAEKNFRQALEYCESYPNPFLYYHLGVIEYSDEKFFEASTHFNKFFELIKEDENPVFDSIYEEALVYQQWSDFLGKTYSNQVPFSPQVVKGLSTSKEENFPCFSTDNTLAFFNRKVEENKGKSFYESNVEFVTRLCMSTKDADGNFLEGDPLPKPFNISSDEGFVTLTSDNNLLYYTVCHYNETYYNCDIFYSEFKDGEWTSTQNAGRNINSPNSWDAQPSITADGKWLYFSSNRPGGFGGTDIWRVKKTPSGEWSRAENLGPTINSSGNEKTPFIHPDGVTLYFSSDGWKGVGGYDVFYSRLENKSQKYPINLGYPINTEDDELGFTISTFGEKGYFSSSKYTNTGSSDILEFDLYEKARPEAVTLITGILTDENERGTLGNIVFLKNLQEEPSEYISDAETGNYTAAIKSNANYLVIAKKQGYAYDYQLITKDTLLNSKTMSVNLTIKPIEVGGIYQLKDINFATNSYQLSKDDEFVINAFVDFLRENPSLHIVIQGHTDNIGDSKENLSLSEFRAKSVYDYLISKRIRSERIEYKGYGSSQPIDSNDTEEGRSKNRRTVFVITRM